MKEFLTVVCKSCNFQGMQDRIAALKEKIKLAFAEVPPPPVDGIIEHFCDDCFKLQDAFKGKNWRTLDKQLIERYFSKLPLFSPRALHYFLPAYLLHALCDFQEFSLVAQFTGYSLLPDHDVEYEMWQKERYGIFDEGQMAVMLEYVDLLKDNPEIISDSNMIKRGRERLKKYWEAGRKIYELDSE